MQKAKREIKSNGHEPRVASYYNFKGKPMVTVEGNFYRGSFNISKNKVKAILDLAGELEKFVKGEYDKQILELKEDEILKL